MFTITPIIYSSGESGDSGDLPEPLVNFGIMTKLGHVNIYIRGEGQGTIKMSERLRFVSFKRNCISKT